MGKSARNTKRTAVITGGGSGIGLAAAQALAAEDFELLLAGRSETRLREAASIIHEAGGTVHIQVCDVGSEEQVASLRRKAEERWGHVDVLFNNAGYGKVVPLEKSSLELWDATISSNLTGTFLCCREFLPLLKQANAPIIINNASVAAKRGFPGFTVYSAAKGGIAAMSGSMREELRPYGIRVTTLYAGAIDSPFWDDVEGEWDRSQMMSCDDAARIISQIVTARDCVVMEELHLMPRSGAL